MMANQKEGAKRTRELNDQKTPRSNLAQFHSMGNGQMPQWQTMPSLQIRIFIFAIMLKTDMDWQR